MGESIDITNALNVCEEYCGPLSVMIISGIPGHANMNFKLSTIKAEEVLFNSVISTNAHK